MTRIKQFANDMGLSYNEAKKLVNKGRRLKDGGSTTLEKFMPVKAKNGKVTRIKKEDSMRAKSGQFKNIVNASTSGGISPEEALKKIRKLVTSKKDGGALKPIPADAKGLQALKKERPDVVASMGFKKKGGTLSFEMGGMNDMEDGNYMAKIESLQIVPTKKEKERPRPGRSQRGTMRGGVPSRKKRSMKELSMKRPKRFSGGGVARGTGAAVKGTGFKGVY